MCTHFSSCRGDRSGPLRHYLWHTLGPEAVLTTDICFNAAEQLQQSARLLSSAGLLLTSRDEIKRALERVTPEDVRVPLCMAYGDRLSNGLLGPFHVTQAEHE